MTEELIDLDKENILSPTGVQGGVPVLNVGHSRMRARYWRQDNNGNWGQTAPLPADPASRSHYFAKGFKARPPKQDVSEDAKTLMEVFSEKPPEEVKPDKGDGSGDLQLSPNKDVSGVKPKVFDYGARSSLSCPVCAFEAKSAFGLTVHLRRHK